ncbi:hypothetical protein BDV19DRAFT_395307 [Aspergillus venezuelensis]
MVGLGKSDSAPPYEELVEDINEQGHLHPHNSSGYSAVAHEDTYSDNPTSTTPTTIHRVPDEEQQIPPSTQCRGIQLQKSWLPQLKMERRLSNPLPPPSTFQAHSHCAQCDAFVERHQKLQYQRFNWRIIALAFISALIFGLLLGVAISQARRSRY